MNSLKQCIRPFCLVSCLLVSGCVSLVSGELKNVPHESYQTCSDRIDASYKIVFETNAKNSYSSGSTFFLTTLTLGLFPSFHSESIYSRTRLYHQEKLVGQHRFKSQINVYYGFLWLLFFDNNSVNALNVDEGAGIRGEWGIRDRSIAKTLAEAGLFNIGASQVCYRQVSPDP
ncbi:hypothetical protein [Salinisphaera sp. Q1T1-3]|uniref:hypothetical protein n=1 Tax=Salinisphaera sp. Q1T1-3 TaxID=2321229 RepID=UPI0011C41EE4|nr:hypothetical protein [Salinisphaera sp. Q1T1-3]